MLERADYRWIWYPAANSSDPGRAHAFRDGSQSSVCRYVARVNADPAADIGLMLSPRFCRACDRALIEMKATARIITVLDDES